MKKLLALLLCMMLCLPVAMAQTLTDDVFVTIDFGDFTMDMRAEDLYQVVEKVDSQAFALVYTEYDENNSFHNNINIAWMSADIAPMMLLYTPEAFAMEVLQAGVDSMKNSGFGVTNDQLHSAEFADGVLSLVYSIDVDYTPIGIDLQMTIWQKLVYYNIEDQGTYWFTLSAGSAEDLERMTTEYINTVVFK